MEHCVIFVTVPDRELGDRIARTLVEKKLAACVNRIPGLVSIYFWQGNLEESAEELLIIKTRQSLIPAVSEQVKALHSYQVPEVVAVPILGGFGPYLDWVTQETRPFAQQAGS